jgi:hypothetical protein
MVSDSRRNDNSFRTVTLISTFPSNYTTNLASICYYELNSRGLEHGAVSGSWSYEGRSGGIWRLADLTKDSASQSELVDSLVR